MSDNNQQPEAMNGESLDISEQRRHELKQLFPGVFTETTNAQGEAVETIDFERLQAELGTFSDVYEGRRERYGMEWPGKRDCMRLIQEPSRATLKPCREESVDFDTTQNLFIEGDNLEVLKLLQKSYYGKVKMIYIDPPYNTGKEFIYPDKYSESLETYLAYAGLVDDEGKKFSTNTAAEGRFHTKWLNMMYPRLYLARNLLREDGVIFISIDDNEVENLRRMCNEIFGEENSIACLVWEKGRKNDAKLFSVGHEYMLVYARSLAYLKELNTVWREEKPGAREIWEQYLTLREKYGNNDSEIEKDLQAWYSGLPKSHPAKKWSRYKRIDKNGPWRDRDISWPGGDGPRYEVIHPVTKEPCKIPERGWIYSQLEEMQRQIDLGFVEFRDDHTQPPFRKAHIKPVSLEIMKAEVNDEDPEDEEEMATQVRGSYFYKQSQVSVKYLRNLLGGKIFNNPKDHDELKQLIKYVGVKNGDTVLDFFAGSASTSEAVLEFNNEEKAGVKFVLIQLPEKNNEKDKTGKAALKAGFQTIADVGKERIRRASQKIRQEREGQLDLEGKGDPDLGFKVLKLDQSNFKQWQAPSAELSADQLGQQLTLHTDHIDSYATQEELLYELLIKAGFMPTETVETLDLAGKQVFSIANGALLICLEEELTAELIDAVADKQPMQFICLDKAFKGNDQLKANAAQTFKSRSQNSETEMVFKVV